MVKLLLVKLANKGTIGKQNKVRCIVHGNCSEAICGSIITDILLVLGCMPSFNPFSPVSPKFKMSGLLTESYTMAVIFLQNLVVHKDNFITLNL